MNITTVVGIAVLAAFLAVLLRRYHSELSLGVGLIACILLLLFLVTKLTPVLTRIQTLIASSGLPTEYTASVFKALGICLLTQLSSDTCRDAGQTALAEHCELAGKVCLLILSLPLFEQIASLAVGLMNGEAIG